MCLHLISETHLRTQTACGCVCVLISVCTHVPSRPSLSRSIMCTVCLWNMKSSWGHQDREVLLLFCSGFYLMSLVVQFFFFFFCDLEQSAVQLFKELSNPALDLSRAAQPNRIVVLTLMTIPPAVAEPPVGHQEETIWQRGRWLTERDRCR